MLLRYSLGLEKEALAVESAVSAAIDRGVLTADVVPPALLRPPRCRLARLCSKRCRHSAKRKGGTRRIRLDKLFSQAGPDR